MKRTLNAWHATNSPEQILRDGIVKPARMPNVYLFADYSDAIDYASESAKVVDSRMELLRAKIS